MSEDKRYTLTEHLGEFRNRLIRSLIAVAITTGLSFSFSSYLFQVMLRPAPSAANLVYTELTEMIGVYIRVALMSGFVLALPYMMLELILFISPGLLPREKRFMFLFVPFSLVLFALGVTFGYFVLLPPALKLLFTFGTEIAVPYIKISNYLSVVSRLLFWLGVIFELPLVTFLLAKVGIIGPRTLAKYRRHALVGAFILSAIITPTIDPVNQTLVALPLIALYEVSIWLTRLARRPRPASSPAG